MRATPHHRVLETIVSRSRRKKASKKNPGASVILLEKANVKRSGAFSMGRDGLNNAVIPGYATPEQYTKEITIANDRIVDQAAFYKILAELLFDH